MALQIVWGPWAGIPVGDLDLEAATIISSETSQFSEGVGLRVLYLAKRVSCQLVGEDAPQVPMDPSAFMLAPFLMNDANYQLWRDGIAYAKRLLGDLDL